MEMPRYVLGLKTFKYLMSFTEEKIKFSLHLCDSWGCSRNAEEMPLEFYPIGLFIFAAAWDLCQDDAIPVRQWSDHPTDCCE